MKPTKSFSRVMRDISSNSHENYYCFGCFHSFRCKSTLEKHTQLCKDHDFCKLKLPENDKKIKEHKQGSKALRIHDIIYVDRECLIVNYDTCSNNPIKSHTTNIAQHTPSGYSINVVRNHNRKIGEELFNTEKKTMTPLTPEQQKKHNDSNKCYICQKKFNNNKKSNYYKNLKKVKDHDHYTGIHRSAAHSICNLRYSTQRDIPVVIHNGSNYDFHLIIKELAKEFREKIHCIPEDKEKYKSFSFPLKYKSLTSFSGEEYEILLNLRFIDSNKFMMEPLGNHLNNLHELLVFNCLDKSVQQIKIKYDDKNIHTRCKSCAKRSKQSIDLLKSQFPNTYHLTKINI